MPYGLCCIAAQNLVSGQPGSNSPTTPCPLALSPLVSATGVRFKGPGGSVTPICPEVACPAQDLC